MDSNSNETRSRTEQSPSEWGITRRTMLAAGGAAVLGGLAGCSAVDGLIDRGAQQLVGTTASAPAAFYPGQAPSNQDPDSDGDGLEFSVAGTTEVRAVPATVRADSREIDLEGWSTSGQQQAQAICCGAIAGKPRPPTQSAGNDTDTETADDDALREYLEDEPTIGERFVVCLPDAKLPGDRGSLAEQLTLDRVLAYFAPSREPDGVRAPFHDQYGSQGIEYDDDGCIRTAGSVSLHEDIACQNILSAELDTYRTAGRGIVGHGMEGGAVVSGAPISAGIIGTRVFLTTDGTGEIILGEDRDMVMPGDNVEYDNGGSGSQTLVCPVAVTPVDAPTALPGLFYVRRVIHDDQIILAGGWILDEGALFEESVTLLFDEGPTEVASVTPDDIESDEYGDRIVEQFARDRSRLGSLVGSTLVESTEMNKAELIEQMASQAFQTDEGRKGLNAVNVKVLGEQGDDDDDDDGSDDIRLSATALDAPLVHLAGAQELSEEEKLEAAGSGEEVDILGMGAEKL
ncbi:hypothetical protein ACFQJ5_14415 [Halomicroarcula sp. GCM10025324]|uniref:hypothetical protein n=1 Tax=Haloarcula TaxID=2237 RepID=UPI0023E80F90|nr:hypothetical protein [Halomicroarcula sp. ZS-22-S1]